MTDETYKRQKYARMIEDRMTKCAEEIAEHGVVVLARFRELYSDTFL